MHASFKVSRWFPIFFIISLAFASTDPIERCYTNANKVGGRLLLQSATNRDERRSRAPDDPELVWSYGESAGDRVPDMYGNDGPRTRGMEQCTQFRSKVPSDQRRWGVAGMPNSGTNALHILVQENCKGSTLEWQVPWGKHNFITHDNNTHRNHVFPIVLVKDPTQWMSSTCRKPYFSVRFDEKGTCPSPVNKTSGKYFPELFDSLIQLWADWTLQYHKPDVPSLMIRFEDLLFTPERTITQVCECMGLTANSGASFKVLESMAKWGQGHGHPHNRSQTIDQYTAKTAALLSRFSPSDHAYMSAILKQTGAVAMSDYFRYDVVGSSATDISFVEPLLNSEPFALDWGEGESSEA